MIYRFLVRIVAWAYRRGVTDQQMTEAVDKSFSGHDEAWRDQLRADARLRNRDRIMRRISA